LGFRLFDLAVQHEQDVVTARQRAGQIASLLGFDPSEQTRIATASSEIVRNAFRYTGGAKVEYGVDGETAPQLFSIVVSDTGGGIPNLDQILAGRYRSSTGMGVGLIGARRLMDRFRIDSTRKGTTIHLQRFLPKRAPLFAPWQLQEIARTLADRKPAGLVEEFQRQNQELLRALDELNRKQEDLVRLNRELEDTNRGVVALYAELDEKADHLRRADELKSRFLSNMTHEFRTPVNAILALTSLLEERAQAAPEVAYLRKAAENLSELVNDLLDLAKVEAGKTEVRPVEFAPSNLFGALRGMLRPLLVNQSVSLVFDDVDGLPVMRTDEGKVSQILRNFVSNALKYTEKGHVRVAAHLDAASEAIVFSVADTGIGIAPEDQKRIFDEFAQVEHPLQRRFKGTGLGLPLSKRLAELLGGSITVESSPGTGSTFSVTIPVQYRSSAIDVEPPAAVWERDPSRLPVLVIDDTFEDRLFYEKILNNSLFQPLTVKNLVEARQVLSRSRPAAIVLDILLRGEDTWAFLCQLKESPQTSGIPVIVVTTVADRAKALALGADAFAIKPVQRAWLLGRLNELTGKHVARVLIVDDQEPMRAILRQFLDPRRYTASEAATGEAGLEKIQSDSPDVILLDLGLPDISGREVLRRVKADPATRSIPVVLVTSARLDRDDRESLMQSASGIVSKDSLTREVVDAALRQTLGGAMESSQAGDA
jgi:signal transduction histidine kinase/CheY-like chemotaxis protein